MKYHVRHHTQFDYELPVIASHHVLRLKPRTLPARQTLNSHRMELSVPGPDLAEQLDYFGNTLHEVRLQTRHQEFSVNAFSEIVVQPRDDILLDLSPPWEAVAAAMRRPLNPEQWEAAQFCFPSPHVNPAPAAPLAAGLATPGLPILRLALRLTEHIYRTFTYQGGVTDVYTPVSDVMRTGLGVCQDFAHVAIAALRCLGLPARYVSGYILSQIDDRPALVGSEATHAWLAVYCPEFGWVDFDPTNNQMTSDQHITLGWGRDYADVAPSRGSILGGGKQALKVDVSVRPAQ